MGGRGKWLLWGSLAAIAVAAALAGGAQGAVFTSPGTGQNYTLVTLETAAGATVADNGGTCDYSFSDSVVISYGDRLTVAAGCVVDVNNNDNLTILGQLTVAGTESSRVVFYSQNDGEGDWVGIRVVGPGSGPSTLDNLSINNSGAGLLCVSCQNLTARNLLVEMATGDGVFVQGGANLTFVNITQVVTTYSSQSAIGINGANGVTIAGVTGTGVADVLTLWNVSNVTVTGPLKGTSLGIAAAWIDNATSLSVAGFDLTAPPTGLRITRSTGVTVASSVITDPTVVGIDATAVDGLSVFGVSITGGARTKLALTSSTNATLANVTLSSTGYGLAINLSRAVMVRDSALSGGNPASAFLSGSLEVVFSNVSASGGQVGILVLTSHATSLTGVDASGAVGDGVRANGSANLTVTASNISNNGGRGLALNNSSGARIESSMFSGNTLDGVNASNGSLTINASAASQNLRHGVWVAAGPLVATDLAVEGNGRDGIHLASGGATVTRPTARNNGWMGLDGRAGSVGLYDGTFENNSGMGVYGLGAITWTVAGSALLINDEALGLAIGVTGGSFAAHNASMVPSAVVVSDQGTMWLDNVGIQRPSAGPLLLQVTSRGVLAARHLFLYSADNISVLDAAIDLRDSWVDRPASGIFFSNATAALSNVTINLPADSVELASGSRLVGDRLYVLEPLMAAFRVADSELTLADSEVLSTIDSSWFEEKVIAERSTLNWTHVLLEAAESGLLLLASTLAFDNLTIAQATRGIYLVDSTVTGTALVGGLHDNVQAESLLHLLRSNMSLGQSALPDAWPGGVFWASDGSVLTLDGVTLSGGGLGISSENSSVDGTGLALSGSGVARVVVSGGSLTLSDSILRGPGGEGIAATGGASIALANVQLSPFDGMAFNATQVGAVFFSNVSVISLAPGFALWIDGSPSFSVDGASVDGLGGGVALHNLGTVSLAGMSINAGGKALEALNASTVDLSGVYLSSDSGLAFEAAEVGALTAMQTSGAGALGAFHFTRIAVLQVSGGTITASPGPALWLDQCTGATVQASTIASTTAAVVAFSPDTRLESLRFTQGGLLVTASARVRLSNTSLALQGVAVASSTDFVGYNVSIAPNSGLTALFLDNLSSADLSRLNITGGLLGINATGGSGLRIRNSVFASASNTSVLARSYANLTIYNVSSTGAPTGFDLRYSANASVMEVNANGSTVNGILIDRGNGTRITRATLSPTSGNALRVAMSVGVRVERLTVIGGMTAVMLHNSTGAWVINSTVSGSSRGLVAGNGSSGTALNLTMSGLGSAGAVAYASSLLDLWNSSVAAAPTALNFKGGNATTSSTIRFYDSPVDNSTLAAGTLCAVEVYWSLRVSSTSSGAAAPGVPVTLFDAASVPRNTFTTDAGGSWFEPAVLELRETPAGREMRSPYSAVASTGGLTGTASFDLFEPTSISLDIADTEGPYLEVRTLTTHRIAFNSTFSFGRNPFDGDNVGILRYEWTFTNETGSPAVLVGTAANGFTAAHRFTVAGRYVVSVQAFDAAGNPSGSPLPEVEVWVNDPPFFLRPPNYPDLPAFEGVTFQLDLTASDNDTVDRANLSYVLTGLPGAAFSNGLLVWTPDASAPRPFSVSVSDGFNTTVIRLSVLVGRIDPGNHAPAFLSEPVRGANVTTDYGYEVIVSDVDAGQTVVIQLVSGPLGMTFSQNVPFTTGHLSWRPSVYYPRSAEEVNVTLNISLRAFDGVSFTYQNYTLVLRNPPDLPPQILDPGRIVLVPGQQFRLDLRQFGADPDDGAETLRWSVKGNVTPGATMGFDTEDPFLLIIRAPSQVEGTQSFFITLNVSDTSGLYTTRLVQVDIVGPNVVDTAFWPLLLIVIVGGIGAAFALATRQRAAALGESGPSTPRGGSPSSAPAQAVVPASAAGFPFYLEGAALYESAESLVASKELAGIDLEEVWVLVPSKARDASLADGILRVVRLEDHDVALLRGGDAMLAAAGVFAGDPSTWLEEPMKAAAAQIQARALEVDANNLEALSSDASVAETLASLLALSGDSSREAVAQYTREAAVRVGSVVELVQGLVRLKVAVDNNSGQLCADARLSVEFDDKVLRLERLEPAMEQKRDKVQIGNLRPGERKTVALYFDPQICTRSFFNATVSWEDARGAFHSTAMRTRSAEVACPAFSTPDTANTAMLKRLMKEELSFRDSKYFRFPAQTSAEQVFEACKQAVLAQDVRLVKELVVERPYRAEAWFFGRTSVKKSPMVIWTAVFGQERVAQFSAASNAQPAITGLLAELGRRLVQSRAGGGIGAPIETMAKGAAAAQVGDRATLLSKSESAEADAE